MQRKLLNLLNNQSKHTGLWTVQACTLASSGAAPWWVSLSIYSWNRQTDRQTDEDNETAGLGLHSIKGCGYIATLWAVYDTFTYKRNRNMRLRMTNFLTRHLR